MKDFKALATERYSVREVRCSTSGTGEGRSVTSSCSISTYGAQLSAAKTACVKY